MFKQIIVAYLIGLPRAALPRAALSRAALSRAALSRAALPRAALPRAAFARATVLLAAWSLLALAPAFADIAAFNAAVKAGEYKAAAAETVAIWPDFDKTSPDTAAVAREFGFANLVAGDFSAARTFGSFLKDKRASLKTPDDQPITSAVLLAAADYRLDAKRAREELMTALQARATQPGLDNISVMAAETLYRGDWSEGAWPKVLKSSATATTLLDRGGLDLKARADRARIAGAAAEFLSSPSAKDIGAMEAVYVAIVTDIDAATEPHIREALGRDMYEAGAWLDAIQTSVSPFSQQTGSNIPVAVRRHVLKQPGNAIFVDNASPLPVCERRFDLGGFQYPTAAEYRGMVGAVTMKFGTNDQGLVTKAEVLGSVPSGVFAEALVKASPKFRWIAKDSADPRTCRLRRNNYVFSVIFRIG